MEDVFRDYFWNLQVGQQELYDRVFQWGLDTLGSERLVFVIFLGLAHSTPVYGLNLLYTLFTNFAPVYSESWRFLPGKRADPALVRRAILYVTGLHIVSPIVAYFLYPYAISYQPTAQLFYAPVPGVGQILASVALCYLCTDFWFYWGHRLLHTPLFYRTVHKQHHEFTVSIGFAAQYAHPFEIVIGNVYPVMFAMVAFRMHFFVWCLWLAIALAGTTTGHSGLWYPGNAKGYHDWHHSANIGNYGSLPIWDRLCGTGRGWIKRCEGLKTQFRPSASVAGSASTPVAVGTKRKA
jgi:sterol desaturase/sphingolipid hydroxylase (fatty acid hydroxylase superfamily)